MTSPHDRAPAGRIRRSRLSLVAAGHLLACSVWAAMAVPFVLVMAALPRLGDGIDATISAVVLLVFAFALGGALVATAATVGLAVVVPLAVLWVRAGRWTWPEIVALAHVTTAFVTAGFLAVRVGT